MKKRVKIPVEGMTCASCALTVKKAIEKSQGTSDVNVNLATNMAVFSYDPSIVKLEDIAKNVSKTGYSLKLSMDKEDKELDNAKKRLISTSILLIPIITLMIIHMFNILMIPYIDIIEIILAIPVIFIAGFNTHKNAFKALIHGNFNMDLLISLGTLASFLTGIIKFFGLEIFNFAFVGAMIMFFHLLGKYLEIVTKGRASKEIKKLLEMGLKKARIIVDGEEVEVNIKELDIGDIMIVRPHEKIPTDGVIVEGKTTIDESMISGESLPVFKKESDSVFGGTINGMNLIKVKVTKVGEETFLSQLIKLVEEASLSKVPIQEFADKVISYFVPTVLIISLFSFLFHFIFPLLSKEILFSVSKYFPWVNSNLNTISLSIYSSIATLVIACPCALGLATPTAIMVSSGIGAKNGIFIRNGKAIEFMKEINTIVFDKTGTITSGKFKISDFISFDDESYKILASLSKYSNHPLSKIIFEEYSKNSSDLYEVKNFVEIPGIGIKGEILYKEYFLGKTEDLKNDDIKEIINKLENHGKSIVVLKENDKILAIVGLSDTIKEESKNVIKEIKKLGIDVILLTGDNERVSKFIGKELSIDKIISNVSPKEKTEVIKKLKNENRKVAMIGDGINDAPSLKMADIGIAIGTGSDIAIEAGDIVLLKGELKNLLKAVKLSKETFKKIKQNLFWAFFYNIIAIPLAFFGFLHPVIAEIAMALSSINLITNSIRLKNVEL
ncbi:MAG: heavy metal translocating P-type ATPase [Caldisericia bacterium]